MNTTLQVVDNFTGRPDEIRAEALRLSYDEVPYQGFVYRGIGLGYNPGLEANIEKVVGFPIDVKLAYFRSGTTVNRPDVYIHVDNNCGQYAGVLYLNPPPQKYGGTAFWRHKATGLETLEMPVPQEDAARWNEDSRKESLWRMTMLVDNKYDRFITYPTNIFHSRYPLYFNAASVAEGRLVWVVFFDRKNR